LFAQQPQLFFQPRMPLLESFDLGTVVLVHGVTIT
jgi:hypothetical protein